MPFFLLFLFCFFITSFCRLSSRMRKRQNIFFITSHYVLRHQASCQSSSLKLQFDAVPFTLSKSKTPCPTLCRFKLNARSKILIYPLSLPCPHRRRFVFLNQYLLLFNLIYLKCRNNNNSLFLITSYLTCILHYLMKIQRELICEAFLVLQNQISY